MSDLENLLKSNDIADFGGNCVKSFVNNMIGLSKSCINLKCQKDRKNTENYDKVHKC